MIIATDRHGLRYVPARGKLDTAADCNVVALDLVIRAGLGSHLEDIIEPMSFAGLDGVKFRPTKKLSLDWRLPNDHRVRTTRFFVARTSPYELLYGRQWMQENRTLHVQLDALLVTVQKKRSRSK